MIAIPAFSAAIVNWESWVVKQGESLVSVGYCRGEEGALGGPVQTVCE